MTDRYSVRIGSERAASKIHVEPLIWLWLREIAAERGIPLSHLMEEIDRCYRLQVDANGTHRTITLSSAVRVFVTEHIASHAVSAQHNAPSRSKPKRQLRVRRYRQQRQSITLR